MWHRSPRHRSPGFDLAFAISFSALLAGGVLLTVGIAFGSGALVGFALTLVAAGLVCYVLFGVKGAAVQSRSIRRSLANGYRVLLRRPTRY